MHTQETANLLHARRYEVNRVARVAKMMEMVVAGDSEAKSLKASQIQSPQRVQTRRVGRVAIRGAKIGRGYPAAGSCGAASAKKIATGKHTAHGRMKC